MTKNNKKNLIIFGASNQIGFYLRKHLQNLSADYHVIACSRNPPRNDNTPDIQWQTTDLNQKSFSLTTLKPDVLIYAAPLPLLPKLLQIPPTCLKRLIAFSTTSRYTKTDSSDAQERKLVQTYIQTEREIMAHCHNHKINFTLLRPTLVYGCGKDKNIAFIANFIKRFGIFPLLGQAKGLRQPVHAEDLALACLQTITCETSFNRAYNLSGGSCITYQQMVEKIFQGLDKPVRLLKTPAIVLRLILTVLSQFPRFRHLSMSMFERMNQDLYFDHQHAQQDFGYNPRPFHPDALALGNQ